MLYLNRRDFSYAPWGNLRKNRSRIDFFLVSSNIVDKVDDCFIKPHTQSKLFDHKAIVLDFCAKKAPVARPTISNSILRDPNLDIVVKLASLECYAQSLVDNNLKMQSLRMIGSCLKKLRDMGPDPSHLEYVHADLVDIDIRDRLKGEIRGILAELDDLNIPGGDITMEADEFLEFMMNNIRNEVVSYQAFINKTINHSFKKLISKLESLKLDHIGNADDISELESKLREIGEIKINATLEKNKNFDTLHSERITPYFLKMVKK